MGGGGGGGSATGSGTGGGGEASTISSFRPGSINSLNHIYEPHHEKICLHGFRPGQTQTEHSPRRGLEA